MVIKGVVHCFFEQSGIFKNEFKKLGIDAYDYDIQNNFGQTDYISDLFAEIEKAYDSQESIFDRICNDDLIFAFFPCIYFSSLSQMQMYYNCINYRGKTDREKTDAILQRSKNREYYFSIAVKMFGVCKERGMRIVMENPWSMQTFLKSNFVMTPSYVDMDRTRRGDFFKKPTAFFFLNCQPELKFTRQQTAKDKIKIVINAKKRNSRRVVFRGKKHDFKRLC